MARKDQDLLVAFGAAAAAAHNFALNPRVNRIMERLVINPIGADPSGLLTVLEQNGHQLHIGAGFPISFLDPAAQVDGDDFIGVASGPAAPMNMSFTRTAADIARGYVGLGAIPDESLPEVSNLLNQGQLVGRDNFSWGLGEFTVTAGNFFEFGAAAVNVPSQVNIPRSARLLRICVDAFDAAGARPAPGELDITVFNIAAEDMLGQALQTLDVLSVGPLNTDEDGLRVNFDLNAQDPVVLRVLNNTVGTNFLVQAGFYID